MMAQEGAGKASSTYLTSYDQHLVFIPLFFTFHQFFFIGYFQTFDWLPICIQELFQNT